MNLHDWLNPVAISTLVLAIVTAVLAVAAFLSIRKTVHIHRESIQENRRSRVLDRIRSWATDSHRLLTATALSGRGLTLKQKLGRVRQNIQVVLVDGLAALADAQAIGGDLLAKTGKAVVSIRQFAEVVEQYPDMPTFEAALKEVSENLTDVINSTRGL